MYTSLLPRCAIVCTLLWQFVMVSLVRADTIYQTDFEAPEGYVAGTCLVGQNGWGGINFITENAAGVGSDPVNHPALGQFGYIGGFKVPVPGVDDSGDSEAKQVVGRDISYTPGIDGGQVLTITMELVPFYDSLFAFDQFGIVLLNSKQDALFTVALFTLIAEIVVMDQLDDAGAVATGVTYESGGRYELRLELDFGANTWSAWFGGELAASKRRLSTPGMAADLGSITFTWGRSTLLPDSSANHYLIFDQLRFSAEPPAAFDADLSLTPVAGTLDMDVSIRAIPGSVVVLEYSPSLAGGWTELMTFDVPAEGLVSYRHTGVRALPAGFYRVAAGGGK